jgi:hypothetical protein
MREFFQDVYEESRLAREQANIQRNIQRKEQDAELARQALQEAKAKAASAAAAGALGATSAAAATKKRRRWDVGGSDAADGIVGFNCVCVCFRQSVHVYVGNVSHIIFCASGFHSPVGVAFCCAALCC